MLDANQERYLQYADRLLKYKMACFVERSPDDIKVMHRYYVWLEVVEDYLTRVHHNTLPKPTFLPLYAWFKNGITASNVADWILWHQRKCVEIGVL